MAVSVNSKKIGTLRKKNVILDREREKKKQEEERPVVLRTRLNENNDLQAQKVTDNAARKIREAQNRRVDALLGNTGDAARFRSRNDVDILLDDGARRKTQQETQQETRRKEEPVIFSGNARQKKAWEKGPAPSAGAEKTETSFGRKSAEEMAAQIQRTKEQRTKQEEEKPASPVFRHLINDPKFVKGLEKTAGSVQTQQEKGVRRTGDAARWNTNTVNDTIMNQAEEERKQKGPSVFKTQEEIVAYYNKHPEINLRNDNTRRPRTDLQKKWGQVQEAKNKYWTDYISWYEERPKIDETPSIEEYNDYYAWENNGIERGFLNDSSDRTKWSSYKLEKTIEKLSDLDKKEKEGEFKREELLDDVQARRWDLDNYEERVNNLKRDGVFDPNSFETYFGNEEELALMPEEDRSKIDRVLIDSVYGIGFYDKKITEDLSNNGEEKKGPTNEEILREEAARLWRVISGQEEDTMVDAVKWESASLAEQEEWLDRSFEEQIGELSDIINLRSQLKNIEGDTEYHSSNGKGFDVKDDLAGGMVFPYIEARGDSVDKAYVYANFPYAEQIEYVGNELFNGYSLTDEEKRELVATDLKEEYFMNQEEKEYFNTLYNAGKKDEAKAFLDALHYSLLARKRDYEKASHEFYASNDQIGWAVGASTVLGNMASGLKGTTASILSLLGNKEAQNPNSDWYDATRMVQDIRGTRAEKWGESLGGFGKWLNGVVYSVADNIAAMVVGGAVGGANTVATRRAIQTIMSMEATSSVMVEQLESGKGETESAMLALGAGAIEAITEKYSLEQILKPNMRDIIGNKRAFAMYLVKSGVAEGSEEIAADMLYTVWDEIQSKIHGHKSELQEEYEKLKADGLTDGEASTQVLLNYLKKLGSSFAAGALSGLALAGSRGTLARVDYKSNIKNNANEIMNSGAERQGQIIEAAKGINADEHFQEELNKYQEKLDNEGRLGTRDQVSLYQMIYNTGSEIVQETAQKETAEVIREEAKQAADVMGIKVNANDMIIASQAAAKLLMGEETTRAERAALRDAYPVMAVMEDIQDQNRQENQLKFNLQVQARIDQKAHAVYDTFRKMEEIRGQSSAQAYEQMIAGTEVADEEVFKTAQNPQGLKYGKTGVIVVNGDTVTQIRGFKNGQVVTDDGQTVDVTEVEATDPKTAAIIEQARSDSWYEGEENAQDEEQEEAPAKETKMTRADALLGDTQAEERGRAQEQARTETETQAEEQDAAETQAETEERTAAETQEETEEAPAKEDRIGALLGNTQQQTQGQTQNRQQGQAQTIANVEQTTQARQQGDVQLETAPRMTGQITSRSATEAFERARNKRADTLLGNTQQTTPRTTGQITSQTATEAYQRGRNQAQQGQRSMAQPAAAETRQTTQKNGKHHYYLGTDEFWSTVLETAQNEDENSGNIVAEALNIRLNIMQGRGMPQTRLSAESAQRLRAISEREYNESEDARLEGRYVNPGKGVAQLNGTEFGTRAFQQQVRQLPAEVQPWANTIAWIAKDGGMNMQLYYDEQDKAVYGAENGIIKINLASMMQGHHPMATLAHEMTHMIEHGSRKGYADLRAFVFDTLEKDGVNVQQRILDKIESYRRDDVYLDLNGAIAEIVAESSEMVFTDPETIRAIHDTKPGLYEKMKSAVKRMITRIRSAMGEIRQSVNRNSAYFLPESRLKEMARLWGIAWKETAAGTEKGTARSAQQTQWSRSSSDAAYMQAVENGDMETAQRMVDERAEETGYTVRGEHGTTTSKHFYIFDKAKANPENDWGLGFYFSDNPRDVQRNYASDQGPDLLNKINKLADQLMFMDGYEELDYDERAAKAREMLSGGEARVIRGALKMRNPVVLGGQNQTFFNFEYNFDEENETVDDMTGSFVDLMMALENELAENYEWEKIDTQPLWESAMDYEGMDARTFEIEAKKLLANVGDYDGNMVAGEVLRAAFERAGYDGIVDHNVAEKFRGMGLAKGTTHYIVFDSSQIKQADPVTYDDNGNVIPLSERFDETKKDIRYSLADPKVRKYMAHWADWHLDENEAEKEKILKKYGLKLSDFSSGPVLAESRYANHGISKVDMRNLYMLDRDTARWEDKRVEWMGLDEMDLGAQYVQAWWKNDVARMEEILMEKYNGIDGVIPYKNATWYDTNLHRQIANLIKEGNEEAIMRAGAEMAQLIPKNAVLVPMPPHTGKVTANTDTMLLAQMISKITGRPVVNALESAPHEKRQNNKSTTAADLGFRQVAEIPDGMIPYFVDNLIASGVTAQAAHDAVGHGITIAYAKTTRGGMDGLKNAGATFSDKYHTMLIPLEARYDMDKTGVKGTQYSFGETTNDRTNRLTAANNSITESIKNWNDDELLTVNEVMDLIGENNITPAFEQWMHNTFDKGESRQVSKKAVERFIEEDNDRIKNGTDSLIKNWQRMDDSGEKIYEKTIEKEKAPAGHVFKTGKKIGDILFGREGDKRNQYKDYTIKDTKNSVRMTRDTIGETISWNKNEGIPRYVIEQVLINAPELLENSKYLGSHINYAHPNGNVNYYISNVKFGNTRDAVVFAVHDAFDEQQYKEKAYVAEIMLIKEKANPSSPDHSSSESKAARRGTRELRQVLPSENSIEEAIKFVNADRFRFFDKEALEGKKVSFSLRDDAAYMRAVDSGDMKTAQRMVDEAANVAMKDSKARYDDGELIKVYHGTDQEFNIFDTSKRGGEHGTAEGFGIYLTDRPEISEKYGKRQIAGYADIKRPAEYNKTTMTKQELVKVIRATAEQAAEQMMKDDPDYTKADALKDTWISNYVYTYDYRNINDAYRAVADLIMEQNSSDTNIIREVMAGMGIRDYSDAMDFYHNILTPLTGFDGMWTEWKNPDGEVTGNIFLVFDSSQIKSADPVTYDDNGDVIPLSERFNTENPDIRYSLQDNEQYSQREETDADINQWMLTIPEGSLNTEAEKTLLRNYKDLRMKEAVAKDKIRNYENQIRVIEEKGQENLTQEEKRRVQNLRIRIQNAEGTLEQTRNQLNQVMGQEGYARMMYQQNRILNDFVYGRTTDEVGRSVEAMQKAAQDTRNELEETKRRISELAQTEAVRRMRSYVGRTTVENIATQIRREYRSNINKQELADRITGISMKMAAGQDFDHDVEDLAVDVLAGIRGEGSGVLGMLKGMTLRLSESQIRELYGTNSNLKEVRSKLAGTGIKVARAEANAPVDNSLDAMWDELCDMVPSLDRDASDLDQIGQIINLVESEKRAIAGGGEMYADSLPDVMADIVARAARVGQNIPKDPKAKAQVDRLMAYIKELAQEAQEAGDRIDRAIAQVDELLKQTSAADGRVGTLKYDIQTAIDYFDQTAKEAILREKQKKQSALIEQLKSDYAQKILKINDEWRRLIERDANARKVADENTKIRNRVNTVAKRLNKLLMRPTNTENIPEHMQGMARTMLEQVVDNDLNGRKLTKWDAADLRELRRVLDAIKARDGEATIPAEMDPNNELGIVDYITERYADIEEGIQKYNDYRKNEAKLDALKRRNAALRQIQEAYSDLWSLIQSERQVALGERRVLIEDLAYRIRLDSENSRFKGERRGFGRKARNALHQFVISGNLTPEYFFKMLKNGGLNELWEEYHRAENTNGLRLREAKNRLAEIAEKYGFDEWDMKQQLTLHLDKGGEVKITLGQLMSLWATWNREQKIGPENSQHLEYGGFVVDDQTSDKGKARSERQTLRPKRVTAADMVRVGAMLTEEQKAFVDDVVEFLSTDMSRIGNEATMRAFGIKKFKEQYYFPFKSWEGVLSKRSDLSGSVSNDNRALHAGFMKQRINLARNALQIGDFMDTVVDHAVAMINLSTMGVATENMQKVLNAQVKESTNENGESFNPEDQVKRSIEAVLTEAYGREAVKYLNDLKKQLGGGAVAQERTIYDKAISLFRKNAVAGSLSVTAQQPLSYIRAAMMINPKYLAAALNPKYWKGSYAEMMEHSGVAVIKDMGRFDMNAGQSAKEYLRPDGKTSRAKAAYNWVSEKSTILPELADRMTWTRIWSAVKMEQAAEHPEMDTGSEEFLNMVAERFNDVMRKTQVYDSALVKSANMRSTNAVMKGFTSFMAEPTLTLNVLADAVQNANTEGGKLRLAKAAATFMVSALLQAAVKAGFSIGRSPNKKKTKLENFLDKFLKNLLGEADPLTLFPGYSDLITLLTEGELQDDALSTVGKLKTAAETGWNWVTGKSERPWYRDLEDSAGQIAQLFTNIPAKNIIRDLRAMYTWFAPDSYADRPTSAAVLKYQALENVHEASNLIGAFNKLLGDAGYKANNQAYYDRLYQAKKEGNRQKEQDLIDFLLNGRSVKPETIQSKVKSAAKADTETSVEEKVDFMQEEGMDPDQFITDQVKAGNMEPAEALRQLKETNPDKDENSLWWKVDRAKYYEETGKSAGSGTYYRLRDAIAEGKSAGIKEAVNQLKAHGTEAKNIKSWLTSEYKKAYLAASGSEKVKIKNSLIMAYKALGIGENDANEIINKWK